MIPPNVGMNEDGPSRLPLPSSRESHDAGAGPDRTGGTDGKKPAGIDPVAEPGQAAEASPLPFDATNGMEPDDARCVVARSGVLRDEHEILD